MTDRTNSSSAIQDRTAKDRSTKEDRPQSRLFESFSLECLQAGLRVRFQARGASMSPAIRDGETVYVKPASDVHLRLGDIVLVKSDRGFRLHRLVRMDACQDVFFTRGDCGTQEDPAVPREQILGVAVAKDVLVGTRTVRANFRGLGGRVLRIAARTQALLTKLSSRVGRHWGSSFRPSPQTNVPGNSVWRSARNPE